MTKKFKFGSHNSMTGFEGDGFVSKLVTLFSRCQKGTLVDQYNNGCIYFDIRYINDGKGKLVGAHGLWKTKVDIRQALFDLNAAAINDNKKVYILISKERGDITGEEIDIIDELNTLYSNIVILDLCQKHPEWRCIKHYNTMAYKAVHKFIVLDGSSIHTLLPIPILWRKLYECDVRYEEENINVVDFICYE